MEEKIDYNEPLYKPCEHDCKDFNKKLKKMRGNINETFLEFRK